MFDNAPVSRAPAEEHAYGYIIEVLTRSLYHEKSHVIQEYVQNGYDAVLEMRRNGQRPEEGKVEIRIEQPSRFICDSGIGLDLIELQRSYKCPYPTPAGSRSSRFLRYHR